MQKSLIKMLFCKHIYKTKLKLRTDREYIVLKNVKNAEGRSLIVYEQMETIQSEPTGR